MLRRLIRYLRERRQLSARERFWRELREGQREADAPRRATGDPGESPQPIPTK